jgi:hypothetical protein
MSAALAVLGTVTAMTMAASTVERIVRLYMV